MGILTGSRILACVSLARVDSKVRTKPLCLRGFSGPILTSSVLCFGLSYASMHNIYNNVNRYILGHEIPHSRFSCLRGVYRNISDLSSLGG